MLRQFHYIDPNGKDQGINVRNRSKELTDLLSDVEKIRTERKKARANKKKYGGVEGGAGSGLSSGMSGSSSRYGGFGSESATYGGSTRQVYGDGGGFGGEAEDYDEGSGNSSRGRERFDEYDEYDEGAGAAHGRRKGDATRTTTSTRSSAKKPEPPKPKEPEIDLFDFGDDEPATISAPTIPSNGKAPAQSGNDEFGLLQSGGDDDDFDDFQSATPAAAPAAQTAPKPNYSSLQAPFSPSTIRFAQPQPQQGTNRDAFSNLFSTTSPISSGASTPAPTFGSMMSPTAQQQPRPSGFQSAQPNYYQSVSIQSPPPQAASATATPGIRSPVGGNAPKPAAGGDAFASLLGGMTKKNNQTAGKGLTMADMAKQKASAGIWGTTGTSTATTPAAQGKKTGGMDDLLG